MTTGLGPRCAALVLAFTFVSSVDAVAQCPSGSPPAALGPRYEDAAQFRAAAQAILNAFADQVTRARGSAPGVTPVVEVRNTPQLISFLGSSNTVVVPWWETQPAEMRATFRTFARGGDTEAEAFFRAFFNRFLIAHEAGHWFQARADRREATLYDNENMANRIAVAFWRTQPDGECFLAELERLAIQAAANLADPTPPGDNPVTYFGANYQTLGKDPLKYGYYQFRFMADALRARSQLDFAGMVSGRSTNGNPVFPGRDADPEVRGFDGRNWSCPTCSARHEQQVFGGVGRDPIR